MINTLKDVTEINGKKVMTNDDRPMCVDAQGNDSVNWDAFDKMREEYPICIDHAIDTISFKMLTKPAAEGGDLRNAQLTELIATGLIMLKYLNNKFPCRENDITITKLEEALMWQEKRTADRKARNVEGKNEQ